MGTKTNFLNYNLQYHKGAQGNFFWVMEVCVTLIKVLVLQIYGNVKNNSIAYFKSVQLTIFQLCLS